MPASSQFEHVEQDFHREPIAKPMLAALVLHGLVAVGAVSYTMLAGLLPHNTWGGANEGSAISVHLVSNALPLPADQKPNDNVLATETPSEAPAPPTPKAQATVDQTAIPIADKVTTKKVADKKQEAAKPIKTPITPPPIATKSSPHTPPPKPDNKAQFGEQASSRMQRATQVSATSTNGEVAVTAGSKGFNYPYYVETIQRKVHQNTFMGEVDPRTPKGTQANILFTIRRDGTATDIKLDKSSGSPTLDRACLRAAQRVDTFGPLPSPSGDGALTVSYYCDYQ